MAHALEENKDDSLAARRERKTVSDPYEIRRLELMAELSRGEVLDIGFVDYPNTFLEGQSIVGVDLQEAGEVPSNYTEAYSANLFDPPHQLKGRTFDTVLAGEVIEHIEQPYEFMRMLRTYVAPGGQLVLSTPNPLGFPVILFEYLCSTKRFYARDHSFLFTPRWMMRMAEDTGFKVTGTRGVGFWLPKGYLSFCPTMLSYQLIYTLELRK